MVSLENMKKEVAELKSTILPKESTTFIIEIVNNATNEVIERYVVKGNKAVKEVKA